MVSVVVVVVTSDADGDDTCLVTRDATETVPAVDLPV